LGGAHELRCHNHNRSRLFRRSRLHLSVRANKVEDFEVAVREAIAEWRRYNPNRDFLEAGCTVLVEKAVFSCSAQAVAEVS
jgi:hypothetical protein